MDQLSGEMANSNFLNAILHCLPRQGKLLQPEESLQLLKKLVADKLHAYAPRRMQEILKHVQTMVNAIADERVPDVASSLKDSLVAPAVAAMQLFCKVEQPGVPSWGEIMRVTISM